MRPIGRCNKILNKNATGIDNHHSQKKLDLVTWKSDVYKLNIDILRPVSNHLNKFKANFEIPDITKFQTVQFDLKKQMNN